MECYHGLSSVVVLEIQTWAKWTFYAYRVYITRDKAESIAEVREWYVWCQKLTRAREDKQEWGRASQTGPGHSQFLLYERFPGDFTGRAFWVKPERRRGLTCRDSWSRRGECGRQQGKLACKSSFDQVRGGCKKPQKWQKLQKQAKALGEGVRTRGFCGGPLPKSSLLQNPSWWEKKCSLWSVYPAKFFPALRTLILGILGLYI